MPGRATHQGGPVQYENALHADGHAGVPAWAVRNDGDAILTDVDLAYSPISVDDTGRPKVVLAANQEWTVALVSDEAANDSDKTLTVTAAQLWHLLWIWVELTTTATVGDRQIVIELQDTANDVIFQVRAGVTQAASLTYYYCFAPSMADLTPVRDTDYLMTPLPPTVLLPAAFQIRVYDNNAVAAAADDLIIQAQYAWKAV